MNDSTRFQENLDYFSNLSPQAAILLSYTDPTHLSFTETQNRELNLSVMSEEALSYFHSNINAMQEANEWFSTLDLSHTQTIIVYGIGLGYAVDAASEWLNQSKAHKLIFLENDLALLHRLFETERGTNLLLNSQVEIHFFRNFQDDRHVFEKLSWLNSNSPFTVSALPFYSRTRPKLVTAITHKIFYDASKKSTVVSEYLNYGATFFSNFYPNMLLLPSSYLGNKFFGKFQNVPAVICGAGPSLKKNLSLLKNLTDRALIFAGGSSINALGDQNVLPHFGAGVDPNLGQLVRLQTIPSNKIPFFYRNRFYHRALEMIQGPRLYIAGTGGYPISEWFEEKLGIVTDHIEEGFNVVHFCIEIARSMGCNPIIFAGLDLAFTDQQGYAPGVINDASLPFHEANNEKSTLSDTVLQHHDIHYQPIHTLWKWVAESEWISEYASEHPEVTFINATEGGLGIDGVANQSLAETSEHFLNTHYKFQNLIQNEIRNSKLPENAASKIDEAFQELRESLVNCIEHLENLKNKCVKSEDTQSESLAFLEADLQREPAYRYILEVFSTVHEHIVRDPAQESVAKKYEFLKNTAAVNLALLDNAMKSRD